MQRSHATVGALALLVILGWTTFGFAGVYPSTLVVPAVICAALGAAWRPWRPDAEPIPALRAALGCYLAGIALQMVPLPRSILDLVSPAAAPTASQLLLAVPAWLPLTIDRTATAYTLLVNAALVVVFLVALRIFATGGVRLVARGVSMIGLLLALIALAQDATARGLMYWRWKPLSEGGPPFGPFVNRNHFATWVVLAVPLAIGYLAAHAGAHHSDPGAPMPLRRRIVVFLDGRAILLTAAACIMTVAMAATLSRSGLLGMAAAAATGALLWRRHGREAVRRGRAAWWLALAAAGAIALIAVSTPFARIAARLAASRVSAADRVLIWKDTLPMIRDFWLTGTGAGTYETGMLVYQRSSPGVRFNQAHNHYLQVVADGGLLLSLPLSVALAVYARQAWRRLTAERSGIYWIRAGAFCGLTGAAAQSVWETGLATPANAVLASILAAIVIHEPHRH